MSIFENLPIFFFILAFFVIFTIFLFGGFVMLTAGLDIRKIERGRRILLISLYTLFITLLIVFVFFLVSYLLQRGEVLKPPETPGEFPPSLSPAATFPPGPQFVEVGGRYFNGPRLLKDNNVINEICLFAILCKKSGEYDPSPLAKGEGYDIIYIGENEKESNLSRDLQYGCWLENCDQNLKNLYVAIFLTPREKYGYAERDELKKELEKQINPPCPVEEPVENNE